LPSVGAVCRNVGGGVVAEVSVDTLVQLTTTTTTFGVRRRGMPGRQLRGFTAEESVDATAKSTVL